MKKLLLLTFAALLAVSVQAQVWQKAPQAPQPFKAPASVNKATITPAEGENWWGYFTESDLSSEPNLIGTGTPTTFMAGIYVPDNHGLLGKATVKAVRVYIGSGLAKTMSNMKVWISKNRPATIGAADYVQDITETLTDGANDFLLDTPYEVNNEGFYIGYHVKSTNAYPIMSDGQDTPNAFWICAPGQVSWSDLNGNGFGKLAFQLLVSGMVLEDYNATPSDFSTTYVLAGQEGTVPVSVTNYGSKTITELSYTVTTDGVTSDEFTVSALNIAFNASATVNFQLPAEADAKKTQKTIAITKVNGQPNAVTAATASGYVVSITQKPQVTPVIEEFTGTWCQWCPVGFVGLEYVQQTYGDKVVIIAVHNNDPMAISDYNAIVNQTSSFPSSFVNRMLDLYPSPYYFSVALPLVFDLTVPGSVAVEAQWADDAKSKIDITATSTFSYSDDNANYGVAFVLIEDGLKGTGSSWAQANALSGNSDYNSPEYSFWFKGASRVTGLEFNHVAVGAWNIATGVANSVPASFTADEELPFTYTADITSKSVIQDKSKLHVVALLIDKSNGSIINAAQSDITEAATGIRSIASQQAVPAEYYTLDGRQLSAPQPGLNVVRMSDGTSRKVVIR